MFKNKLNTTDVYILGKDGPMVSSAHKDFTPTGSINIADNGTYDVTEKASAVVNVSPDLGTKSITANGTYNASSDNLDGYSQVTVNVPSSATGTINITENANRIDVSSYEYANVNVPSPSYVKNPIEFDYNKGYVDKTAQNNLGIFVYQDPTNCYCDIYTVENGKTYRIMYGETVSTRARGCLTQTDVRTLQPGEATSGEAKMVGIYSGTINPGDSWSFTAPFDGYFIMQKTNYGVTGLLTYFYCIDDMNAAVPSGTINIADNGTYDVTNYASAVVNIPKLPSDTTLTYVEVTQNTNSLVVPYDSTKGSVAFAFAIPMALQGSNNEYSFMLGKMNFLTQDFDQRIATYFNYNHTTEQVYTGSNAGTVTIDTTNHTVTFTTKDTNYYFKAGDAFNVFLIYFTQN